MPRYAMLGKGPCLAVAAVLAVLATDVHSWFGLGIRWADGAIPVPMTLSVGSGWNAVAGDALTVWNDAGSNFRFQSTTSAGERPSCRVSDIDNRNVTVWGADFCGRAWGEGVLAIAHTWYRTTTRETVDSDVHFNSNFSWSSYRGNLRRDAVDFGRVAIHEFGHVLGLDHPDDHGQSVSAIMNSRVSNIDTIQADDIAGVRGIYGDDGSGGGGGGGGCTLEDLGTATGTVTVTGALGHDCVSPNYSGELARYYSFTLGTAGSVEIDLVSSEFDAWLTLREGADVSGRGLVYDNDGGQGTNARIETALSAGTYTIEATSLAAGETGAFTLALTVGGGGGGGGGCTLEELGTVTGAVTVTGALDHDCVSPNWSGELARYYSFTLGTAGSVEIDLVSSEFDAWLTLREGADVSGRALINDDDGGQGSNARIETALSAGTYTIETTSYSPGETGAFTLTLAVGGGGGGGCARDDLGALSGTVTRVGNLGNDCESPNYSGRLARYYSFTLGQAGAVEIDLFSTAFDTFLTLREGTDVEGRLVATDDDGGQGTNSRIARELSAGTYTIEATSYAAGVTGAFTLRVTAAGGGGGGGCALDDLGALSGTATRVGNLGDDCESPNYGGRLARYYSFTLGQAGPVEIDLVSSVFDTFLALREGTDVAGRLVVSDDDGGLGTNSRISTELSAGTYTIEATSYATRVTGEFTLTATAAGGGGGGGGCALDDLGALSGTVTRVGNLGDDCASPSYSGRLARYYSFTLGQAGPVEINLVSSAFDTFLALRAGADVAGRPVATDDDGGQGTNSRIATELSPGTYTIEATSYAAGVTGAFTLTATAAGGGGGGGCAPDDLGALSGRVTRSGNLGDDCASPNYPGRLARYYRFALGQPGSVEIDLMSSAFDALLALRAGADAAGRLVATDDDGGQGTNSRLVADLSAGTYTIEATSYAAGATGAFTLTVTAAAGGGGDVTDRAALVALYDATGGAGWTDSTNWRTSAPLGEWFGVTTDTAGRVTALELAGNGLIGFIPAALGDMASLRRLDLGLRRVPSGAFLDNSLTGTIPADLGRLVNLERLSLSGNDLTGPIPDALGSLVNLEYLNLGWNDLTGPIPASLGNLTRLTYLQLYGNAFTGSIPPALGNLVNLWLLYIGESRDLTGPIPASFGNLTQLTHLYLALNGLTGQIPVELGNLANLEYLYLGVNALTGPIPVELGRLENLRTLCLYQNDLTGPVPASFGNLANLGTLYLAYNPLTGSLPRDLTRLSLLSTLNIEGTEVCVPSDAAFQRWLATIADFTSSGLTCDADANRPQSVSAAAAESAASFTDHPIVRGVTPIKAVHFTELRTRIDALRVGAGLARFQWTDPVLVRGVTPIRAVYLQELRAALGEAYVAAGRAAPGWTDGEPTPGATPIRAVYVMEIRAAVLALE